MRLTLPAPHTASWLALLGLTLLSFKLGARAGGQALMLAVLALTLFKGHLVVSHFMGLRHARPAWRLLMSGYLLTVGAIIATAYFSA